MRRRRLVWVLAALVLPGLLVLAELTRHGWRHGVLAEPPTSPLLLDRQGRYLARLGAPDAAFGYWPLAATPARVAAATVALEDRRFRRHPGVDPLAVLRAAWQNLASAGRVSGASTLAMQVARMQRPGARGYWRKAEEMSAALFMTARHGREAVLRQYLRLVPYGNRIRGIGAAAQLYFGKPVADLSWAEVAFLAAIPQAPALSNPYRDDGRERARRRAAGVLERLAADGVLTSAARDTASQQLRRLRVQPRPYRPLAALHPVLAASERLRREPAAPVVVRARLDLDLQQRVSAELAAQLQHWRAAGADNAAALVVELADFSVRAWVGSAGYGRRSRAGAIDFVTTSRSPGSTLKPFIYALALERGVIAPDSVLADVPGGAGLANADRAFLGPLLPRQALANSRNLPAVRVLRDTGLHNVYWMLHRAGLHAAEAPADHYGLGLAVGALPSTLERLVTAYGALASDGVLRELRWFEHERPAGRRVLDRDATRLVTLFLADAQARLPSFQRMGSTDLGSAVALKTGTSQGYRDAWTVAWTPRYMVGVWVGRADAGPMHRLGGAGSAALLAGRILELLPDGGAGAGFAAPLDHRLHELCAYTGAAAGPGCTRVAREWLARPPRAPASQRVVLDRRSHTPAGPHTPARFLLVADLLREAPPAASPAQAGLRIVSPPDGLRLMRLAELPAARQTLALRAELGGPPRLLRWAVNGTPFAEAPSDAPLRWPLAPGDHQISVGLAAEPGWLASARVRVD